MAKNSAEFLADSLRSDPAVDPTVKARLDDEARKATEEANRAYPEGVYRTGIWFIGLIALLCVIIIGITAVLSLETPEALTAVASAAIGALAGLFASTRAPN